MKIFAVVLTGLIVLGLFVLGDILLINWLGSLVPIMAWTGLIKVAIGAVVIGLNGYIFVLLSIFAVGVIKLLVD